MNLTQKQLDPILFRTEETGREIEFTLLDPDGTAYDLTDYELKFTMLKPDGNVIYQDLSGGVLTQTEQMTTARGIGYYAIRVSDHDTLIYTGQGKVVIDDHVITDETLNSISEVDGLTFPDDFLTVEDHVAVIDDTVTTTEKTWSSSKISDEIENVSVVVSKTAEGNPIEISDAADAPLVKCVTAIIGYQSGAGTPSPDNVRPIVAYNEGEIEVVGDELGGVNLMPPGEKKTIELNGVTVTSDGKGRYTLKGTNTSQNVSWFTFSCKQTTAPDGSSHSLGFMNSATGGVTFYFYNGNTEVTNWSLNSVNRTVSYSVLSNKVYDNYRFKVNAGSTVDITLSPMICAGNTSAFPSTFSTYYKYYEHTTTYPSAIYRGSEDCVKGEVTAERIKVVIDGSNIAVASVANYNLNRRFSVNYNSAEFPQAKYVGVSSFCKCDKIQPSFNYTVGINNNMPEVYGVFPHSSAFFITLPASVAQTTAEANTWLSENNIVICYELNTPVEVSVTPTKLPIKSLFGYNHIESSTGDMEVEYITQDYRPLVDSIVMESERKITKLWDAGFTPSPGVWLEYDFGEDLENYDAIVIEFVVDGWEGNYSDSVTIYPQIQHLNTNACYNYVKGTDYGIHVWHVSGTTYALGAISGNYPPQYKAVYGIKY